MRPPAAAARLAPVGTVVGRGIPLGGRGAWPSRRNGAADVARSGRPLTPLAPCAAIDEVAEGPTEKVAERLGWPAGLGGTPS